MNSTNMQPIILLLLILIDVTNKPCSINGESFVVVPMVEVMMQISTGWEQEYKTNSNLGG